MTRVPLSVITGFLGSGKTTLVRRLLARGDLGPVAVIVNEFGEVGLDHELIESGDEDLVELSTGCLCCAMRGDLSAAVRRLMDRRAAGARFERIVLETTGLADPAPILQSLLADPVLRAHAALQQVVVTVDAVNAHATLDAHAVSRKQVALADRLLITKTDLAPAHDAGLRARLRGLNRDAPVREAAHGDVAPAWLFEAQAPGADPGSGAVPGAAAPAHGHAHDDITSVCVELDRPLHAVGLTLFLQALAETCGADLLRVKGIVALVEEPERVAVVHGVQHVFHPLAWRREPGARAPRTRLVLIGRRLRAAWVHALLASIEDEVGAAARQ